MDTTFTRQNAQGSREDARGEIAPGQICGELPKGFDPKTYETRAWRIQSYRRDGDRIDLGGRLLEILATPGHTPDAICLLDSAHGLLFTGDTYNYGEIWLFRPESDVVAYGASVRRLAAQAPQIQTVLGAHYVPVAPASVLSRLLTAFEAVRAGKIAPTRSSDKARYKVDDISFLMRASDANRPRDGRSQFQHLSAAGAKFWRCWTLSSLASTSYAEERDCRLLVKRIRSRLIQI
jgi:glyoxylase-like metal-dependent hydrolase (beta-lactamase superfamily II)